MDLEHVTRMKEVLSDLAFWFPVVFGIVATFSIIVLFNAFRRNV